jgi:hypothetical protein
VLDAARAAGVPLVTVLPADTPRTSGTHRIFTSLSIAAMVAKGTGNPLPP